MDNYLKIINGIPSTPDIMGRYKYFNSVIFVPFLFINNEYHLLFQKRSASIRQGGEICFPGGKHEHQDHSLQETAIRETVEELGIQCEKIVIDAQLDSIVAPMGAVIDIFIGKININNINELNINKLEVEQAFTIPIRFFIDNMPEKYAVKIEIKPEYFNQKNEKVVLLPARDLDLPSKYHKSWNGVEYPVYVYKTEKGIIWGITAEIIFEIIKLIKS